MTWHVLPFYAFDLETTGTDPETARIVTASVIELNGLRDIPDTWEWLVNPGIDIPEEASAVHGISTEYARIHGKRPEEVIPEIARTLLGNRGSDPLVSPVVAFNAAYDLTVLHREILRYEPDLAEPYEGFIRPVVDPMIIDKFKDRYRKGKRKLGDVCAHHGVKLENAHTASADAMAAGLLAIKLAELYPELTKCETTVLHDRQAAWYKDQAENFATYLRRMAATSEDAVAMRQRADGINTHWPIQPIGKTHAQH